MDLQDGLVVFVGDDEFRGEWVPLLHDVAHCVTGGGLHLQLREGGGEGQGEICTRILQI